MSAGFLRLLIAIGLLTTFAGCGDGLVKVQGEVLLDEKPLPKADIMLTPDAGGRPAIGKSDTNGKFQLTTASPNDGVKPGTYKVSVTAREVKFESQPGAEEGYVEKHEWLAPEKYSVAATSGLVVTVKAGEPKMRLELKSDSRP